MSETVLVRKEVLEQALEALEEIANAGAEDWGNRRPCVQEAYEQVDALRAALAQEEQEEDERCPTCGEDGGTSCGMPNCGLLAQEEQEPAACTYPQCQTTAGCKGACSIAPPQRKQAELTDAYRKGFIDGQIDMRDRPEEQQAEQVIPLAELQAPLGWPGGISSPVSDKAELLRMVAERQAEPDTDCHAQGICQRSGYSIGAQQAEPVTSQAWEESLQALAQYIGDKYSVWYGIGARDVEGILHQSALVGLITFNLDRRVQQAEPSRTQRMRDAGYTRRPTLRELMEEQNKLTPSPQEIYTRGFRDAVLNLSELLNKLRDPVTVHHTHHWLLDYISQNVAAPMYLETRILDNFERSPYAKQK